MGSDGYLYGVSMTGGASNCPSGTTDSCGTVFRMTRNGTTTILHSFDGSTLNGALPDSPLIEGSDGALYGTTLLGGAYGRGIFFRLTREGGFTLLHSFGATLEEGQKPTGRLLEASDGFFYGATAEGGAAAQCVHSSDECGTIYRIRPDGREFSVLHSFGVDSGDGWSPNGALVEGSDGNFYGTTSGGGDSSCSMFSGIFGCGVVFRITPAGTETVLHAFTGRETDGAKPGNLLRDADGTFYATTYYGGGGACPSEFSCGTVFRMNETGALSTLYVFSKPTSDGTTSYADGFNPQSYLTLGTDGALYGVTESGGELVQRYTGTVFRLTKSGEKTILLAFGSTVDDPKEPFGGLVQGPDGKFYGVVRDAGRISVNGARIGSGAVFQFTIK